MRRPDAFSTFETEDMTSSKSTDKGVESQIHHMMRILNSSQQCKKVQDKKTFGTSLKDLISQQTEEASVPFIIIRICSYIEQHGLNCKGIFRINGHLKTVEYLRTSVETYGDANLEETGDVIAAANLLKMFIRELPEALIPNSISDKLVEAYESNQNNKEECARHLKQLVELLPEENFATLRYLMGFLAKVAFHADHNCMTSLALGIVFGPNIFRVPDNLEGIRLTTVINQIVTAFIENFSSVFETDAEENITNPCRMSDCVFSQDIVSSGSLDGLSNIEHSEMISVPSENPVTAELDDSVLVPIKENQVDSDSDISSSSTTTTSPNIAVVSTEFVEMTISKSVNEHLFGCIKDTSPIQENVMKARENIQGSLTNSDLIMKEGESSSNHCENKIPGVSAREEVVDDNLHATPDLKRQCWNFNLDEDVHETKRHVERSQLFQRLPSSKMRKMRKNVRKSHSLSDLKDEIDNAEEDSLKENENHDHPDSHHKHLHKMGHKKAYVFHRGLRDGCTSLSLDFDPLNDRPSHPFLELHPQAQTKEWLSEDLSTPSPGTTRKPYLPPLDLSILHEHGDGNEPIPASHLQPSWPLSQSEKPIEDIMLSPRTIQLKREDSIDDLDPNIPPSPPVELDAFSKGTTLKEDEDITMTMKQLNKKIYNLKKKIKHFEEEFEETFGYKPSHADKMTHNDIKKYMLDLSKARKDVKQLKEEALKSGIGPFFRSQSLDSSDLCLNANHSKANSGQCNNHPSLDAVVNNDGRLIVKESLDGMMQTLSEKRRLANRPEDLREMNKDQVLDEKLAIQKSLLQYESVFGRPTSQMEKDLMRPMYDRYRNVKRLLTKQGSPKTKDQGSELEPILEHQAMDFIQASPQHRSEQEVSENKQLHEPVSGNDASSTNCLKSTLKDDSDVKLAAPLSCNLHELAVPELLDQQHRVKVEKKRLRRILREFENEFQLKTGHRIQREDRAPLEAVYGEYKQIKARLRLLEALLFKHESRFTI